MKTVQLPPVCVTPEALAQIDSVPRPGESLSQFVETATLEAAGRRPVQQAFIARGRAALATARKTGELHAADDVLQAMQDRLNTRVAALRQGGPGKPRRPGGH